ncbi:hypothetical protein [Flavobacterium reichenbachii]|uniref:Uncharacterized protein n=1 Tax=Flavobacterium reichenbachii TaxID=362418 RepID=A0A085ZPV3_9FLAO|nr:hypothetical protein [Flavobacterium reichenbachii]KFF06467.1 hypothetical protein IW19_13535 [Flavobacterium reichenbachii]OXB11856.1 hypothetical protein B0A68_20345 [Flavobacterium reichenbachii]
MINKEQNIPITFSFDKNGNVKQYSLNKGERQLIGDYTVNPDLKWSISSDSIFYYLGYSEKIQKILNDTIYSIDLKTNKKYIYYRVKENLNIKKN